MRRWLFIGLIALSLSSCGYQYPSADRDSAAVQESMPLAEAPSLSELLPESLRHTQMEDRFWYSGWVASFIGKRQINSMFDGIIQIPDGFVANTRVNANPLRFIHWDGRNFIDARGRWVELPRSHAGPDPFASMETWTEWAPKLDEVRTSSVLGLPAWHFRGTVSMEEWLEWDPRAASTPVFEGGTVADASVQVEVWIGREDPYLYQYRVTYDFPLPGAGRLKQEVFFRFYRFGDPGIEPVRMEDIERFLEESRTQDGF